MILGGIILLGLNYLALGITTHLTDAELVEGKPLPMSKSWAFVKSRLLAVLGVPFMFIAGMAGLGLGIFLISLIGRIPYIGPIFYGLVFLATFAMAFSAVLLGVLLLVVTFSYIPAMAREQLSVRSTIVRVLKMVRAEPGRYLLHVLLVAVVTLILFFVLSQLLLYAMAYMGWLGSIGMRAELTNIFDAIPWALFSLVVLAKPATMEAFFHTGTDSGWQYSLSAVFVLIGLMLIASMVVAFLQVYFCGAGAVNYHLMVRKEKKKAGGE
jgi:hypothetical protein